MSSRKYVFWFHYNKAMSAKAGCPQITIHHRKRCYFVDNVVIEVPTRGHINSQQPRFVVKGKCSTITVDENNVAWIK